MKLKRRTVLIIVLSWILFFAACFLAFLKLDQMHTDRITNEKIFSSKKTKEIEQMDATDTSTQGQASVQEGETKQEFEAIKVFMGRYYECIKKNDLESLKPMVEDFDDFKKTQEGLTQYVEEYRNLSYIQEPGATADSCIIFVTYQLKIKNIDTLAPGMTPYYLIKKDNSYLICNNEDHYTKNMINARNQSLNKDEIKQLTEKINKEYEKAVQSDAKLKNFLENSQGS